VAARIETHEFVGRLAGAERHGSVLGDTHAGRRHTGRCRFEFRDRRLDDDRGVLERDALEGEWRSDRRFGDDLCQCVDDPVGARPLTALGQALQGVLEACDSITTHDTAVGWYRVSVCPDNIRSRDRPDAGRDVLILSAVPVRYLDM
jgi:hypothetical protein